MDHHQRGRSPSAGHSNNPNQQNNILRHTPSPASHHQGPFQAPSNPAGLLGDQSGGASFSTATTSFGNQFDQSPFGGAANFNTSTNSFTQQTPSFNQPSYLDSSLPEGITSNASFGDFGDFGAASLNNQLDPPLFGDLNQFSSDAGALDPALAATAPSNLMNQMSTQAQTSPTPPHLLSPSMQRQHSSGGSPHNSPGLQQTGFQPPHNHSRHTSLDPSSAAYPQNWNGMQFQHRRVPSDAHSDVSSSAHPSPYLGNVENFEGSPLLNPQQDPSMYQEVMGIGQFSLNDQQAANPYISPAHSPHVSPRLMPQQHLPTYTSADNYGMGGGMVAPTLNSNYNGDGGLQMFPDASQEPFPALNVNPGDAMSPPVIRFEPAPPSRQASFEPLKDEANEGALSPPDRSRSQNRMRAKSDSSLGPRSHSASGSARESKDMLSPAAAGVGSRSPSPSGKSRRSSTSSVPNRDYLLGLADPSRSPSDTSEGGGGGAGAGGSKRTQKHPATFQCGLCPKRFTRAYNLRSHLRTHTDERPFVCSVCGKAFARQHDRKRHESLHSGEKKFVCRGNLKEGGTWGCGRRFARADALGRHFRSEAGRVCIKPLLEEEALERQAREGANAPGMLPGQGGMIPMGFDAYGGLPNQGQAWDPNMGGAPPMPFRLPTVLLQQYPTLGSIWDTMPMNGDGGGSGYEDEISGRSSFDASGGEYDEDDYGGGKSGWASDVGVYGGGS